MSKVAPRPDLSALPETPCVGLCSAGFDPVCRGCGRTSDECAEWLFMDDDERAAIWQRLLAAGWTPRRAPST